MQMDNYNNSGLVGFIVWLMIISSVMFLACEVRGYYILKTDVMLINDKVNDYAKDTSQEVIHFKSSALLFADNYSLKPIGEGTFEFACGCNVDLCVFLLSSGDFYDMEYRLPTGKKDHDKIISHCEKKTDWQHLNQ